MIFNNSDVISYEVEVEAVYAVDDYCAYFTFAQCKDGYILNEEELDELTSEYSEVIDEYVNDYLIGRADFLYDYD
jgi:hypothetical protein